MLVGFITQSSEAKKGPLLVPALPDRKSLSAMLSKYLRHHAKSLRSRDSLTLAFRALALVLVQVVGCGCPGQSSLHRAMIWLPVTTSGSGDRPGEVASSPWGGTTGGVLPNLPLPNLTWGAIWYDSSPTAGMSFGMTFTDTLARSYCPLSTSSNDRSYLCMVGVWRSLLTRL